MVTADAFHRLVYGFVVQAFYCWRIYILRKGLVIPITILLVWLTGGAVADVAIAGVLMNGAFHFSSMTFKLHI
ncbi:hypothetical protein K438DRAFT_1977558 [Mycena galopus ATCC 62051]|nr:hypothetical protein K438DRAFT_1977558 [Mycena galopus ATCC 62051]